MDQVKGHTISLLVSNKPGMLIRIALVFARRGFNIDSLVVSPSSDERFSVMNIDVSGDKTTLDQIIKQVNKLVDVVHATDYTDEDLIQRELALIKVKCQPEERPEVLQLAHALECVTLDLSETTVTFQITGPTERLDNAQMVLSSYGVVEMIRTGKLIMARGEKVTS
ncbi:MAG: acetolactate synthase small subunit [Spirochaetaceae bacterium]|nr:MAG: acetolactate synthase small subunit [Spirochaetaceae bacterium]